MSLGITFVFVSVQFRIWIILTLLLLFPLNDFVIFKDGNLAEQRNFSFLFRNTMVRQKALHFCLCFILLCKPDIILKSLFRIISFFLLVIWVFSSLKFAFSNFSTSCLLLRFYLSPYKVIVCTFPFLAMGRS